MSGSFAISSRPTRIRRCGGSPGTATDWSASSSPSTVTRGPSSRTWPCSSRGAAGASGAPCSLTVFAALRDRGQPVARLYVDAQNVTDAVHVYEAAGMQVSRRFDVMQKPLAADERGPGP